MEMFSDEKYIAGMIIAKAMNSVWKKPNSEPENNRDFVSSKHITEFRFCLICDFIFINFSKILTMFEFDKNFEMELSSSVIKRRTNKFVLLWKIPGDEISGAISSSPLLYNNLVVFGCGDHYLYALDVNSGKPSWKFRASQIFVDAKPVEGDGLICMGSYDGNVYAVDAKTGKEAWRFKTGDSIYGSCLAAKGKVYFGSKDSYVYAVDAKNGKEIWRFKTGADVGSAPTLYKMMLYVGSFDGNLYVLRPETGEEIWRFRTGGNIVNPLPYFAEDDVLYIGCTDGNVYAIDIGERKEIWRFRTGGWILASPRPVGDFIYFVSSDGNIYCVDKDGKQVWRFRTDAYMDGSPVVLVENGVLYYGSSNGNLYTLDAKTGREIWRFKTDGEIISSPLMHEGRLYFGSMDCHFYCIGLDGREVWRFKTSSSARWKVPPASEWFEFEVEIKEEPEETKREYGKGVNVSESEFIESEYSFKSEYAFKSEYHTKSEYR